MRCDTQAFLASYYKMAIGPFIDELGSDIDELLRDLAHAFDFIVTTLAEIVVDTAIFFDEDDTCSRKVDLEPEELVILAPSAQEMSRMDVEVVSQRGGDLEFPRPQILGGEPGWVEC